MVILMLVLLFDLRWADRDREVSMWDLEPAPGRRTRESSPPSGTTI
jgi:hypothetical protein